MQSRTRCFDAARGFYHPGDIHANGCRIWKNYDNAKNSFIWYSKKRAPSFAAIGWCWTTCLIGAGTTRSCSAVSRWQPMREHWLRRWHLLPMGQPGCFGQPATSHWRHVVQMDGRFEVDPVQAAAYRSRGRAGQLQKAEGAWSSRMAW